MSDNVVGGPWQIASPGQSGGERDLDTPSQVVSGGGGPQPPITEARVAALEADMKEVKAGIGRLEVASAALGGRIDTLTERLHAHGETLGDVRQGIRDLGSKVDAKLIGGGQMFGIFGGLMGLFMVLAAATVGVLRWAGLLH